MDISCSGSGTKLKVVVVGDGAVGKTCILHKILASQGKLKNESTGEVEEFNIDADYEATTFDTRPLNGLEYEGQVYDLEFYDTAGQEAMKALRRLSYADTDVFVLGYAINKPATLTNISRTWIPDVTEMCPDAVIILAGFKVDMREGHTNCVTTEMAQQVADDASLEDDATWIRAVIETSAKTGENCELLLKLMVAIGAAKVGGTLDERFPTFQKNEETGEYPQAEHLLNPGAKPAQQPGVKPPSRAASQPTATPAPIEEPVAAVAAAPEQPQKSAPKPGNAFSDVSGEADLPPRNGKERKEKKPEEPVGKKEGPECKCSVM